jgi:hypothetical protein
MVHVYSFHQVPRSFRLPYDVPTLHTSDWFFSDSYLCSLLHFLGMRSKLESSFTYFGMTVEDFRYLGYSCSNDMFGAIVQTSLHSTRILRFLMYVYVNDHAVNGSVMSLLLHFHFLLVWPNGLVRCSFPIFHFWNKVLIVASYAPFVKMRDQRGNKWILTGDSNNCIFCYWLPYFIDD